MTDGWTFPEDRAQRRESDYERFIVEHPEMLLDHEVWNLRDPVPALKVVRQKWLGPAGTPDVLIFDGVLVNVVEVKRGLAVARDLVQVERYAGYLKAIGFPNVRPILCAAGTTHEVRLALYESRTEFYGWDERERIYRPGFHRFSRIDGWDQAVATRLYAELESYEDAVRAFAEESHGA